MHENIEVVKEIKEEVAFFSFFFLSTYFVSGIGLEFCLFCLIPKYPIAIDNNYSQF